MTGEPLRTERKMRMMPISRTAQSIPVASRVNRFSYAIRNIVAEAQAVEARGTQVRYLNIGDPVAFGFQTPPHLIEAVERAMRDGHNGYLAVAGDRAGARGGRRGLHGARASRRRRIACSSRPARPKRSSWC